MSDAEAHLDSRFDSSDALKLPIARASWLASQSRRLVEFASYRVVVDRSEVEFRCHFLGNEIRGQPLRSPSRRCRGNPLEYSFQNLDRCILRVQPQRIYAAIMGIYSPNQFTPGIEEQATRVTRAARVGGAFVLILRVTDFQ